jgi:hypothetical protein
MRVRNLGLKGKILDDEDLKGKILDKGLKGKLYI